jgi:glucose-1-phosphate adenylyltransferase
MAIDDQRRIVSFAEKPAHPAPMPNRPDMALASMGIYVFDAQALFDALASDATAQAPAATLAKTSSRRWWRKARPWHTRLACLA